MNPLYNQNYTREQIDAILNKIKDCVVNNRYTIALNENRQENVEVLNMKFFMFLSRRFNCLMLTE